MMEEPYGLHPTSGYTNQPQPSMLPPENLVNPVNFHTFPSPAVAFGDRVQVFGSDLLMLSGSSVSDAASTVAEIPKGESEEEISSAISAKIVSHPLYPKLVEAYIDCQKVGAPPEIACVLDGIRRESNLCKGSAISSCLVADPELDEFMETYCEILAKYRSDLLRSFNEASAFLNNIENQLKNLCNGASRTKLSDDQAAGSSEKDYGGEIEVQECQQTNDQDRELKDKLLRKYGGCISTLKREFSKKKKKGKLPGEAREILLDWWRIHNRWPYPTEADKVGLAEATGLDQKQINNWFINQRKRHWKPSEDTQFAVMDRLYGPYYMND